MGWYNSSSFGGFVSLLPAVLNDISANDNAGKQVRATAKAVCIKAQKLVKDREYEEKKKRGRSNNRITETSKGLKCEAPVIKWYIWTQGLFE